MRHYKTLNMQKVERFCNLDAHGSSKGYGLLSITTANPA